MKIIIAKTGEQIFVDDENFDWLSQYKWEIFEGYARRGTMVNKKSVRVCTEKSWV